MIFLSQYDHDLPLEWFDKQIYANFGIDVFKKPFPKDGVCCYSKDNIELLVIRLEANQDTKLGALREFLDLEDQFQLYNANVGSSKNYAKGYQRFRSEVTFEAAFLDKMYNNKYCRYFYGKDAIRSARNKWSEVERKVAE